MMFKKTLYILTLLGTLFSCDITGENTDVAEEIQIAETVIYDFRQVKVEKGRVLYEIEAERAETFAEEDMTKIYNMKFEQYDKDKELSAEGQATLVDYNIENENATVDGEMSFTSNTEGVTLTSSWLDWNNEKKTLTGKDDIPVRLEKKSGTVLEGRGFQAITDTKTVSFSNGMEGVFVPDKDEKESDDEDEAVEDGEADE